MPPEENKPSSSFSAAGRQAESAAAKKNDPSQLPSVNRIRIDGTVLPESFAHDLNNCIAIINGYSEVCLEYLNHGHGDEKIKKHLNAIHDAVQQATGFTRQLLALSSPKKTSAPRSYKEFPQGSESILVIEDEVILRELLHTVLGQHGYRITLASNGEQATKIFSTSPKAFDLILLDLQLPDISGLVVLNRIKQTRPGQKVITVSGRVDADTAAVLERLGVRDHLRKPYHLNELGHVLRNVIARAA